jgi:hypothetical protein
MNKQKNWQYCYSIPPRTVEELSKLGYNLYPFSNPRVNKCDCEQFRHHLLLSAGIEQQQ